MNRKRKKEETEKSKKALDDINGLVLFTMIEKRSEF